ncbi:hypothetical protein CEUSTIGMA_g6290.t1 [Chlamydomonas eustigma]|uniref:Uncharacterized protein n=1 Tax=Chlamydomonas eustigma TaxID=1157962 RepID=A0A250X7I7_9CHLO|nr:hypothetical protein CEUSTIGMA_g6290.t1 [Chlamydomonas eustigma]|eukprot:GAX78852.1 hypothetical protein CEUSTIGMA_g6290.t1 [Chlamydomonas eustigma]
MLLPSLWRPHRQWPMPLCVLQAPSFCQPSVPCSRNGLRKHQSPTLTPHLAINSATAVASPSPVPLTVLYKAKEHSKRWKARLPVNRAAEGPGMEVEDYEQEDERGHEGDTELNDAVGGMTGGSDALLDEREVQGGSNNKVIAHFIKQEQHMSLNIEVVLAGRPVSPALAPGGGKSLGVPMSLSGARWLAAAGGGVGGGEGAGVANASQ